MRTQFERIILKAKLKPWPKLFVNLRSTRVMELNEVFPSHVVAAWMGHSEQVERKHFLQVTEDHYQKATHNLTHETQKLTKQVIGPDCTDLQEEAKTSLEMAVFNRVQEFHNLCNDKNLYKMGVTGLERADLSTCEINGLRKLAGLSGTQSGTVLDILTRRTGLSRVQVIQQLIDALTSDERVELMNSVTQIAPDRAEGKQP